MKLPGFLECFTILPVCISVVTAFFPPNMPRVCYTAKNELAPSYLMPCLTDTVDDGKVYGCCVVGDYCLENQACFSPVKGMIYHKGCTEKDYDDGHCPSKCHTDQTKSDWVGLIFCNGTNNTPKDTWICQHPDNCLTATNCGEGKHWDPQLELTKRTYCEQIKHDENWVAFQAPSPLKSTASLPQVTDVVSWWSHYSGYTSRRSKTKSIDPGFTDPYRAASTKPTDVSSSTTLDNSTLDPTQPTSSDNATTSLTPTPKSNGHMIGLTVGLCLGISSLAAGVGLLLFYIRRRRNKTKPVDPPNERKDPTGAIDDPSGYSAKAELPAEERPAPIAEMDGASMRGYALKQEPTDVKTEPSIKDEVYEHKVVGSSPMYELPG